MGEKVNFEVVLKEAVRLPMVKIRRDEYLRRELGKYYPAETVEKAIAHNPAYAGIHVNDIDRIAKAGINYETTKVTALSFGAGLPGGFAMVGTIPADLAQYFGHILRILQKLIYLYGWEALFMEDGSVDDETANLITLFVGVMFGVNGAASIVTKVSASAAQRASKVIAQKALTKGAIYPIVKKIAQILGVRMTKEIFAKGVSKAIPIIGGVASGGLTFATYKPMARKLRKYLAGLPCADVEYYKNSSNFDKPVDVEFSEEAAEDIIADMDKEL